MNRFLLPLAAVVIMLPILYMGLQSDPSELPSQYLGKPVPVFDLPTVKDPSRRLSSADLVGQVSLVNIWATWCVGCRQEHAFLNSLAQRGTIPIYAINWRDNRADALQWLDSYGDPYVASGFDGDGRVGIDWGAYGAPGDLLDRCGWNGGLSIYRPSEYHAVGAGVCATDRGVVEMMARGIFAFAVIVLATSSMAIDTGESFDDPALQARYENLIAEVRCVTCQNQSIKDSNAFIASDLRREIRRMIDEGKSDAEVKEFLVTRYGDFVLYRPRFEGKLMLLWIAPGLFLLLGGIALVRIVRHRMALPIGDDSTTEESPQ